MKQEKEIEEYKSDYFDYEKGEGGWDKLTENKLNYIIEESRLFLQAVWEGKDRLSQKTSFLLAIVIGLIGFIFTEVILKYDSFVLTSLSVKVLLSLYFLLLIIVFLILIKHQLPSLDHPAGTAPKNLLDKEIIGIDFEDIAVKQLQNYQNSINHQIQRNNRIAKDINLCFKLVFIYPVAVVSVYGFNAILGWLFFWGCSWSC